MPIEWDDRLIILIGMHEIRRILMHDWPVMMLVMLNLAGMGLYLGVGPSLQHGAGYRVIDIRCFL